MRNVLAFVLAANCLASSQATVYGQEIYGQETTTAGDFYLKSVKPLLQHRCYSCHGGLKQEAGLRLDTGAAIRKGGDSGPVVSVGDGTKGELISRLTSKDDDVRMPPEGKPLSMQEIALVKRWIASGAVSPKTEKPEEDPRRHWAFQAPQRPAQPADRAKGNAIDAFLAAARHERGLKAAPPAKPEVLLRRLYVDLIGLPPTRHELRSFLKDPNEAAYLRRVDELLLRPEHGERWARHWMDIWRYSDWYGRRNVPDALNSYGQIWRWRDWIVRSLNEDKGYDRMIQEMLAADEIAPLDQQNLVATGFVVRNFYRWNYNTWMKDLVEHTGKAFLGVTLNCCHCHDHKYDPFSNEDYFAFRAFFEPIDVRQDRVPGEADPGKYPEYKLGRALKPLKTGMVRIHDAKIDAKTFIYSKGESRNIIKGLPAVAPQAPRALIKKPLAITPVKLPPEAWYPGLQEFVRQEEIAKRKKQLQVAQAAAESATKKYQVAIAQMQLSEIKARIQADRVRYQGHPGDANVASQQAYLATQRVALAVAELQLAKADNAVATAQQKKAGTDKLIKAQKAARAKVDAVKAAIKKGGKAYQPLSPQYPTTSSGRRSALARWITQRDNPLAARVAVNHIWNWHFGRPLVESTENFGRNGTRPSHQRLLDWLAVELMDSGWKMKRIHRLIVTSDAYRMSSRYRADAHTVSADRDNRWLWRFRSRRADAEVIRDSLLYSAGQLDGSFGGQETMIAVGMASSRRSLYIATHGEGQMPWLQTFDAPSPVDCYRRTTSVRPQQALAMSNTTLTLRQGRLLARRLHNELERQRLPHADRRSAFVQAAFESVLSRGPTPAELEVSLDFLERQATTLSGLNLRSTVKENVPPSTNAERRAEENLVQALYSHSDFITVR